MTDGRTHRDPLAAGVSLDGLFRANAMARPDALALIDPPDRASFTDGSPQRLTYRELDQRVERLARRLQSFGMAQRSVVAMQLPNISEAIVSLLAILRAGHVAVPVPALWRRSDLVAALRTAAPKALITLSHLDGERPVDVAREVAADLFDLSFPCAFGTDIADGVVVLDEEFDVTESGLRLAGAGESIVPLATFDADADGYFAAGRSDAQWLAAGLPAFLESGMTPGDSIVSTLPPNSLAGIATALVPWLLCGGTLELVHGHNPAAIATAASGGRAHLVAPASALADISEGRLRPFTSGIAVRRGPGGRERSVSRGACERLVDVHCFGEIAVVALARTDPHRARPVPLGGISAPAGPAGAPVVIETRIEGGQIAFRGPIVPRLVFSAAGSARLKADMDGLVGSGFRGHRDSDGNLVVEAGPENVVSMGGLRFGLHDLQSRLSASGLDIRLTATSDPLLGQRLHIDTANPEAALAALQRAGHSRLLIEAAIAVAERRGAA